MSRGVNRVFLIGNLGKDPEVRAFPDGGTVANVSIATSEAWTDKNGEKQERTEWHRVVFRDRGKYRLGQIAAQLLSKGSKVYVEGSLRTRSWETQTGEKKYTTEVIASDMQLLGGGEERSAENRPAEIRQEAFDDLDVPF